MCVGPDVDVAEQPLLHEGAIAARIAAAEADELVEVEGAHVATSPRALSRVSRTSSA